MVPDCAALHPGYASKRGRAWWARPLCHHHLPRTRARRPLLPGFSFAYCPPALSITFQKMSTTKLQLKKMQSLPCGRDDTLVAQIIFESLDASSAIGPLYPSTEASGVMSHLTLSPCLRIAST